VAGRSTRSLDVTVSSVEDQQPESGPSDRAVALSRAWLVILGILWAAFGVGVALTAGGIDQLWGGAMVAFGIVHFIVARYASRRAAFIIAWFGP